jgi:hypothetical protein
MLRVCCAAATSKFCRAKRRMHDEHWGSSEDLLSDAMAAGVSCNVTLKIEARRPQIWR